MRRLLMLLLVLLFPLQLFAGTLTHMPEPVVAAIDIVSVDAGSSRDSLALPGDLAAQDLSADAGEPDSSAQQCDLEDQTLPGQELTLSAVWHSFPHLFPRPAAWASSFIDIVRPPPSV